MAFFSDILNAHGTRGHERNAHEGKGKGGRKERRKERGKYGRDEEGAERIDVDR